jgi:hypothetical protein
MSSQKSVYFFDTRTQVDRGGVFSRRNLGGY